MNPLPFIASFLSPLRTALLGVLLLSPVLAMSGPGAHGPNGEHLEAPAAAPGGSGPASPRIEAQSDLFELVGTLAGGELSILIDRFATNEPLLKAEVEVESGGVKARAKFHADMGDYSVDDPALLKKLSAPGEHPLVITVLAGNDTDLLDAVLRVGAAAGEHAGEQGYFGGLFGGHLGDDWTWRAWAVAGAALAVALLALFLIGRAWRRRRALRTRSFSKGGLA